MDQHDNLADEFAKYFEIVYADTPQLRRLAFRLRYQVYCLESRLPGFDAAAYPDGEETDRYDKNALHVLLFHRPSNAVAGTLRIVRHDPSDPLWMFPLEEHAGMLRYRLKPSPRAEAIGEVSRFILSARFRSRRGEGRFPDGLADATQDLADQGSERRHGPHPMLGLLKALLELSWRNGIAFWYAGMESRLQRRLDMFGVGLHLAAEDVSYHGTVNAYLSSVAEVMRRCRRQYPENWRFLTDEGTIWPTQLDAPEEPRTESRPVAPRSAQENEMKTPPPKKN